MKIVIILWKTPFFEMLPDHSPVTSLNLLDLKFFLANPCNSLDTAVYGKARNLYISRLTMLLAQIPLFIIPMAKHFFGNPNVRYICVFNVIVLLIQ